MPYYSIIKKLSILLLVAILLAWILKPFLYPIIVASLLAIMLSPCMTYLEKHIGKHKSSLLIVIVILLCVFIPLLLLISYATAEIITYIQNPELLTQSFNKISHSLLHVPYVGEYLQKNSNNIIELITQNKVDIVTNLGQFVPTVTHIGASSIGFITDFLITLLLTYQFLVSGNTLERFVKYTVLNDFDEGDRFISTAIVTIRRVSLAIFLTASLVMIFMWITFASIGLPSPALLALVSALASMIPFMVGIIYVIIAIVVFILMGYTKAIIILVIGLALNIFTDNIMQPKIINKQVKLSFAASLIGIMGGIHAFGIIGVFLGPVIFNVAYVALQKLMNDNQK